MKILDAIEKAKYEFVMTTGKEASELYLGRAELKMLREWIRTNQFADFKEKELIKSRRCLIFSGLTVFEMKAPHHLSCA